MRLVDYIALNIGK